MAHGVHDGLVSSRATRQYLTRIQGTMGATNVRNFLRYYEIPGYNHAVSSQFNASWDSVTVLESLLAEPVTILSDCDLYNFLAATISIQ